jgi:DNA-binding transcriptional LysR family regulator
VRFFLAVVSGTSLAAGARQLGVDQTTVSRRLAAFQRELGVKLFERTPDGLILTAAGRSIEEAARRMEASALAIERRAVGEDARPVGSVKLTTTETLADRFIVPELSVFHAQYPDISVELITDSRTLDISRRQADVAIRVARPREPELVARKIAMLAVALYASYDYLARHPIPRSGKGLTGHELVYYGSLQPAQGKPFLGESTEGARVAFRSNSTLAQMGAVRAGLGIGALPCYLADEVPELVRIWPNRPPEMQEIWLVMHADVRHGARVRAFCDFVVEVFSRAQPILRGLKRERVARREQRVPTFLAPYKALPG